MNPYRRPLPQLGSDLFLTDSGLETTLVYHHGIDLPCFAAFPLLRSEHGRRLLEDYYRRHAAIALELGLGFVLESVTWRASAAWGAQLGYSEAQLDAANREAIGLLVRLRDALEAPGSPMVISACVGPRGDGYRPDRAMTVAEAEAYHHRQLSVLAETRAELVSAFTLPSAEEGAGIARSAAALDLPAVISFTLETDGRLPSGQPLAEAIAQVDEASGGWPSYYMINCAHPTHFAEVLEDAPWTRRIRGLRCNASRLSHAELERATNLDDGDPEQLGSENAELWRRFPRINVLGGCCGTDHRHIAAIAAAVLQGGKASSGTRA